MATILVVEDEAHIAEGLRFNLQAEGHRAELVESGEAALVRLGPGHAFDLVVLDVMLPGKDGFDVMTEIRAANDYVPVLMLTARGRSEDVMRGFAAGADDYVAKPFELGVLLARINGLLRRRAWAHAHPAAASAESPAGTAPGDKSDLYRFDGKTVDFNALELRVRDRTFHLTLMESELLRHLIRNAGRTVSRKSLLENVWNLHEDTDTRAIDNFIVRLRRYLEDDPAQPRHLLTVRGVGYRFVPEPKDTAE
jgi:DNA-binding response OmpR family regulator